MYDLCPQLGILHVKNWNKKYLQSQKEALFPLKIR